MKIRAGMYQRRTMDIVIDVSTRRSVMPNIIDVHVSGTITEYER